MGYIDKKTTTFTCDICGTSDDVRALEKGDAHGTSWQSFESAEHFSFGQKEDPIGGPSMTHATCKKCQVAARIDCRQSFP
jgi:hypothetical protein